jgi:hypothetical protein
MGLAGRLDDPGKPFWIVATILGFMIAWPVGLAILVYLLWSGKMGFCMMGNWSRRHCGRNHRSDSGERWRDSVGSSGNRAFDDYRAETLRRLEEEQKEFADFLEQLRRAKDKADFDQFMAERGRRNDNPEPMTGN